MKEEFTLTEKTIILLTTICLFIAFGVLLVALALDPSILIAMMTWGCGMGTFFMMLITRRVFAYYTQ